MLANMKEETPSIDRAAEVLRERWAVQPRVGIVLGTGLNRLADAIERQVTVSYAELPEFPRCTALGHTGRVIGGTLADTPVVALDGRFHLYEGYTTSQIVLPVRLLHRLGVESLIVTNAAGAVHPYYEVGDVVVIVDHIDMMFRRVPIARSNVTMPEGRSRPDGPLYDSPMIEEALCVARRENFVAHRGVYVSVTGPNYETRAEYRFFRRIGGDVVGMSTVPEVLVAASLGLRVLAMSVVTNVCLPDALSSTDGQAVIDAAVQTGSRMEKIVTEIVARCAAPRGQTTQRPA